jgi:hypothetical protein
MDQHKAAIPIRMRALSHLLTPFNQLPNILLILVGAGILKAKYTIRQTIFANGQLRNK